MMFIMAVSGHSGYIDEMCILNFLCVKLYIIKVL